MFKISDQKGDLKAGASKITNVNVAANNVAHWIKQVVYGPSTNVPGISRQQE